jgi:hypothetical protein
VSQRSAPMTTTMMSTTKGTRTSPNAAFSGISKYRLTRGSNGRGNGSPPSACGYEGHDLDILRRYLAVYLVKGMSVCVMDFNLSGITDVCVWLQGRRIHGRQHGSWRG